MQESPTLAQNNHHPFIKINRATVNRRGKIIFQDLNFEMQTGENWAIVASSGAEKTAFLETLLGRTNLIKGSISREFASAYQQSQSENGHINSYRDLIAYVSQDYGFTNKSNVQEFYYQQRFNSMDVDDTYSVEEYLLQQPGNRPGHWNLERVLETMDLNLLRHESLIKLSNGETRRLALGVGLLRNPKLFLMDRPMTGLDVDTRARFGELLQHISDSGIQIIMTTTPNEVPGCIHRIGWIKEGRMEVPLDRDSIFLQEKSENDNPVHAIRHLLKPYPTPDYIHLAEFRKVSIIHGGKPILDQLDWKIKPGERWLLKGHNGAGKSTLVSLLVGENPQAYANEMYLFDRKRGSGESIWDVKRPTGFVSPELSRFFPRNQTCWKVVLSGLFDTMGLFKKVSPEQEQMASTWMKALSIYHLKDLRIHQIGLEEQRFCLLARAMIKKPALLVLDEAAQGMDEEQRFTFKKVVEEICKNTTIGLVYVSHYIDDVPSPVDRQLVLEKGKCSYIGKFQNTYYYDLTGSPGKSRSVD
jgi:molybdate transport system ATP-binding protein